MKWREMWAEINARIRFSRMDTRKSLTHYLNLTSHINSSTLINTPPEDVNAIQKPVRCQKGEGARRKSASNISICFHRTLIYVKFFVKSGGENNKSRIKQKHWNVAKKNQNTPWGWSRVFIWQILYSVNDLKIAFGSTDLVDSLLGVSRTPSLIVEWRNARSSPKQNSHEQTPNKHPFLVAQKKLPLWSMIKSRRLSAPKFFIFFRNSSKFTWA